MSLRTVGKTLTVGGAMIHDTPAFQQLEKGIIIECMDKENKITYFYPPFECFRNTKKMNMWVKTQQKYYENLYESVKLKYWKLLEYSCIEINRDAYKSSKQ